MADANYDGNLAGDLERMMLEKRGWKDDRNRKRGEEVVTRTEATRPVEANEMETIRSR